jgi:predicted Zn-dependent protease
MKRISLLVVAVLLAGSNPGRAATDSSSAKPEAQASAADDAAMNQRLLRVGTVVQWAVRQKYPDFRKGKKLRFKIVKDEGLNAAAAADGNIQITTGMMKALANRPDDELAAVLSHEATHVGQRHHRNQLKNSLIGAVVGAVLGRAIGGDSDSTQTGAQAGGALVGATYSRDDEYRADAGGVELITMAGYDGGAMARVLETLKAKYGSGQAKTPVIGWFASHPDTGKRIENANRRAVEYRALAKGVPEAVRDMWKAKDYTLHIRPADRKADDRREAVYHLSATYGDLINATTVSFSRDEAGKAVDSGAVTIEDITGDQVTGTLRSPAWKDFDVRRVATFKLVQ